MMSSKKLSSLTRTQLKLPFGSSASSRSSPQRSAYPASRTTPSPLRRFAESDQVSEGIPWSPILRVGLRRQQEVLISQHDFGVAVV
jgi:hypothetical protein